MIDALLPLAGILLPVAGWGIACLAVRGSPATDRVHAGLRTRLGTATRGLTVGAAVAAAILSGVRVWAFARGISVAEVVGVPLTSPPVAVDVVRAWGRIVVGLGLGVFLGTIGWAMAGGRGAPRSDLRPGGIDLTGSLVALFLGVGCVLLVLADPVASAISVPLDLSAAAPLGALILAAALAARPQAPRPEPEAPRRAIRTTLLPRRKVHPGASLADPLGQLAAEGLVATNPDHVWEPRTRTLAPDSEATRVWMAIGGRGEAPGALGDVLKGVATGEGILIPDLPGDLELQLLAAVTLGVVTGQAGRALVVHREPRRLQSLLVAGIRAMGQPSPGPICAGPAELKDSIAAQRLPAAVILTPAEANSAGVPYLAREGRDLSRELSVVVLSRPDLLEPVAATHLYFTMARLGLLLEDGATLATVVTAQGTVEIQTAVERMLGRSVETLPLRLPTTSRVRIHRGVAPGDGQRESLIRAIESAVAVLTTAGVSFSVEDAADFLGARRLGLEGTPIALDPPGTLRGDVCLLITADAWLGPIFRSAQYRLAGRNEWGQLIVWWVLPSPLANFLLTANRMAQQLTERMLPAPAPLFARNNKHLQRLHLQAALHEGTPEEWRLRQAFGSGEVSELLKKKKAVRVGDFAEVTGGTIRRSHVLAPAPGQTRPDTARTTVTSSAVMVIDGAVGDLLDRVDRLTAATRYYPHRVFGKAGRRYQVRAGGGSDPASGTITVDAVGNDRPPTRPRLAFSPELKRWIGERDSRRESRFEVQVGRATALVMETVDRAVSVRGESYSDYDQAVTSRYSSEVQIVWLKHLGDGGGHEHLAAGLTHLARLVDDILVTHLQCRDQNLEVEPALRGFGGIGHPALLIVDRHVGGGGMGEALSLEVIVRTLRWAQAVMKSCRCDKGCKLCTPPEVLHLGAKNEAIALLGN